MIHLIAKVGGGLKTAEVISDDLISDLTSANIRAGQELADSTYIKMVRTLEFPHEPNGDHAIFTSNLAYQPLGIYGVHVVTSRTITLTPTSSMDQVTLEQYRLMEV
jgi:hypothetical protein